MAEEFEAVVNVTSDTTAAKAEVAGLSQRIRELENTRIKVRADTALARLEVANLKKQISDGATLKINADAAKQRLDVVKKSIQDLGIVRLTVDADTLQARAKIRDLNDKIKIRVDADEANRALNTTASKLGDIGNISNVVSRVISTLPLPFLGMAAGATVAAGASLAAGAAVGGLVGVTGTLGAVAASQNALVQNAFTRTKASILETTKTASASFAPALISAADRVDTRFQRLEPRLKRMFDSASPSLNSVVDSVFRFADNALPGMEHALANSQPIVDGIGDGLDAIGTGVGAFFDEVAANGENAGETFRGIGHSVGELVTVVGQLASGFSTVDSRVRSFSRGWEDTARKVGGPNGLLGSDVADFLNVLNKNPLAVFQSPSGLAQDIAAQRGTRRTAATIVARPRQTSADIVARITGGRSQAARITAESSAAAVEGYQAWQAASESLTAAEAAETAVRTQNARSEASARRSVASAQRSVLEAQESGLKQIAAAEKAVAEAQKNTRTAQVALTQARVDAARALEDMRGSLRDLPDMEEAARIRLARAQLAAEEAALPDGASFTDADLERRGKIEDDLRRREALLDLKDAQDELDDTLKNGQRTREEVAEAERLGIENSAEVLAAKENLQRALEGERAAEQALGDTRVAAARSVQAANESLAVAVDNLNQTISDNAARAAEASARTKELSDKEARAKADADILAASLGITTDQLGNYIGQVNAVPTLALKMTGENELLTALDGIAIKARALELLALNPTWTAEKATQKASDEISATRSKVVEQLQNWGLNRRGAEARAMGGPIHGPGTSRSDDVPIWASNGEYMQPADAVSYYGHGFMEAVRTKQFPRFAQGGLIDWSVLKAGSMDLPKLIENNGIYDRAKRNAQDAYRSMINQFSSSAFGPITGDLAAWINQAIELTGVGPTWAGPLNTLIQRESGGNPRAINNWDSNAQRGDPSRGLMQTIGSTFAAYRDPRLPNDIYDPVANIVAGINYIRARYGSIFNVQQANPNAPPQGYKDGGLVFDDGGMLPTGQTLVSNRTGKPEPLLRADQAIELSPDTLRSMARLIAQVVALQPIRVTLPNGKVLADTVGDAMLTDITVTGISY